VRSCLSILLILCGIAGLVVPARAEVLQSSGREGGYWIVRDGGERRLSGLEGEEMQVNLPPGAVLHDLEPTRTGWLAAGRLPTTRGSELLIIESRDDITDLMAVPARSEGQFQGQPVLLIERDRLVGLVWAEGDAHDQLAIRAAPWTANAWGTPELISPTGPGSQLAPVGTVLDDGSWLVVWPAFDGTDDEIRWSRRIEGEWTSPERIHPDNDVPDILPDVIAIDGGALAAWSWFDGNDYRLRISRLTDGVWSDVETLGARGSVEAGLVQAEDGVRLLYKTVMPASWTVLDLDRDGFVRRQAVLRADTPDRPLVLSARDGGVRLHWPAIDNQARPSSEHVLDWRDPE
jgi:hypothetical protein